MSASKLATVVFVSFCVVLHFFYGILCLVWGDLVIGSTALAGPLALFDSVDLVGVMFLLVSILAVVSMWMPFPWNVMFLLPQQGLLFLSASSAMVSIIFGMFATGRVQPRALIAAEQVYAILLALFHGVCIIMRGTISAREAALPSITIKSNGSRQTNVFVTLVEDTNRGPTGPTGAKGVK
jgi:hypothetical protein